MLADDVEVSVREDAIDPGEAKLSVVMQGDRVESLFTISAVGMTSERISLAGQPGTLTSWLGADGRPRWTARLRP